MDKGHELEWGGLKESMGGMKGLTKAAHGTGGKWRDLTLFLAQAGRSAALRTRGQSKSLPRQDALPVFLPQTWVYSFKCILFLWLLPLV